MYLLVKMIYCKLNRKEIEQILPHRDPFLFIDEITEYVPGEYAKGVKHVGEDEYYFKGHFPGNGLQMGVVGETAFSL